MICNKCKIRPATVVMTKLLNNQKVKLNLCQPCASEESGINFNLESQLLLHKFLSGLLGNDISNQVSRTLPNQHQCSQCGLNYNSFTKNGKFGCGQCYVDFQEYIHPLLGRIHGAQVHTGKIPQRAGTDILIRKEIADYKREMQKAIEKEEFERAAELRDIIKEMEGRLNGGMNNGPQ